MRDTFGKSVTELEIVYDALTPKSLQESHTLFFMRDEASYKGIPDHMLPVFYDDNPQQQKQLKNLKNRIIKDISELGGYDDKIISYHIDWDEESNGFNETDEKFSILVMEHLKVQIESELEAEAFHTMISLWSKSLSVGFHVTDVQPYWHGNGTEDEQKLTTYVLLHALGKRHITVLCTIL